MQGSCTRCGACAQACPQSIIRVGSGGFPEVDFSGNECTFCGACAAACPEAVFAEPLAAPAFSHVVAVGESCLARAGVHCQSCGDACPEAALLFRPRLGGPPLPQVVAERCSGCGACISACPTSALAAARPLPARNLPEAADA